MHLVTFNLFRERGKVAQLFTLGQTADGHDFCSRMFLEDRIRGERSTMLNDFFKMSFRF